MKTAYDLKSPEADKFVRTIAKCLLSENIVFYVEEFSPEQIMLICENYGEIHLILSIKITCESRVVLPFECPD